MSKVGYLKKTDVETRRVHLCGRAISLVGLDADDLIDLFEVTDPFRAKDQHK